ncbi:MAG: Uma2 family endonuclease, partial [Nitrospinae bacterium]|nr:Uma2 family endonuclease [Nitrospinota bacterium]
MIGNEGLRLPVKVVEQDGTESFRPYLLRLMGWTEEQYFKEAPEMRFVEFEDGELIVHSPVNVRHQRIVGFLTFLLRGYVCSRNLGEVLNGPGVTRLRPGLNYEPDIFVVLTEHSDRFGEQYFAGAPALVVEVIAPSTRSYDLRTKAPNYRAHGVPEYWALDPERKTLHRHLRPEDPSAPYLVTQHTEGRLESQVIAG